MSVLVVGTVAFDAIETPYGKTDKILGGAATYICLAASYFCNQPGLVSVVGNDFSDEYIKILTNRGIDIDGLQFVKDKKSFFWAGKYHQDLNNRDTLSTELNVLADFNPIVPEKYKKSKILMLGNLTPAIQINVIEQMNKRPELIIMDTMNFWMNNAWDDLLKVLKMVDVITVNDEEARQLSGEYFLPKAAKKIHQLGPRVVIIKKGEHGALLFAENKVFSAPALPIEQVCDPTGAGDTFAGGFIGYLMKKGTISFETMKAAIICASAMASFTVEKFGTARIENLTLQEIDTRLQQFVDLTKFEL